MLLDVRVAFGHLTQPRKVPDFDEIGLRLAPGFFDAEIVRGTDVIRLNILHQAGTKWPT